jgi:hypothetical protein
MTFSAVIGGNWFWLHTSGTATITSAGKTLVTITQQSPGGTVAFADATTISNSYSFNSGTLQLPAGLTTSIGTFTTTGSTLKYLTSSTPGTQATISSTNNVNASYLSVEDSNATGGGTFTALLTNNNVDAGNNTGWIFTPANGNYFLMF